jgi:hypothetical protein
MLGIASLTIVHVVCRRTNKKDHNKHMIPSADNVGEDSEEPLQL